MADGSKASIATASLRLSNAIESHESAKTEHAVALAKLWQAEERKRSAHAAEVDAHAALKGELNARRKVRRIPA